MIKNIEELNIGKVYKDEPMKGHTTMKIGGPAKVFVEPRDENSLVQLMKYLKSEDIEYFLLGGGANLIVTDEGIDRVVVSTKALTDYEVEDDVITVGAGLSIVDMVMVAKEHNLTGAENLNKIPGTIGGGITMNAGAFGTEFADIVTSVKVLDSDMNVVKIPVEDMGFGYRQSNVKKDDLTVLSATIQLQKGAPKDITERMDYINTRRINSQPLNFPSAGSTFKRPEGHYAAKLIEDAGLKGVIHRGMRVSDKHSGFVINFNDGNFEDWLELINIIKKQVKDKYDVELELENMIIGEPYDY